MQWIRDTETLLKSPGVTLKDETIPMEKLLQQSDLVEVGWTTKSVVLYSKNNFIINMKWLNIFSNN